MIDDLLQRWYATGAVEDGHRYVAALQHDGWLAVPSPQRLFDELAPGSGPGALIERHRLDDGQTSGVALEALQQLDGQGRPRASLLRAWLDDVPYLVLPQRWTRSPVRMLRLRVTTCPEAAQIGRAAHSHWLERARTAYGLSAQAGPPRSQRPTSTSAVELDLGELMAAHWRRALHAPRPDVHWLRRLLAQLDLVLSFRGERGESIDPALVAFDVEMLPDSALERIADARHDRSPGVQRLPDDTWQIVAWAWTHDEDAGEQVARLTLHLERERWWFEKQML